MRWPIVAGVLAVLLVAGIVATALVAGGRHHRGGPYSGAYKGSPEQTALELAVADAGGIDVLADDPGQPGQPGAGRGPGEHRGGPGRHPGLVGRLGDDTLLVGTVVSAGNGTLAVIQDGGAQKSVTTDDKTRVRGGGNGSIGDLTAGERVIVRVGAGNKAVGVLGLRPHVAGTVTALDGNRATITRGNGLVQVVDVSTVNEKPKVGDLIAAVGSAADNGATLKADTIRVLPKTP